MSIRQRRLEKGWSQEELARHSGLSTRTIQRIESGQKPGLESLKCLAAVFETQVSDLVEETPMNESNTSDQYFLDQAEQDAIDYVQNLRAFNLNWITALVVLPFLYWLNLQLSPGFLWVKIVAGAWVLAMVLHAAVIFGLFSLFGGEWEQRQFQKRMNRYK